MIINDDDGISQTISLRTESLMDAVTNGAFDRMSGVISIAGRHASGKTFVLLNIAKRELSAGRKVFLCLSEESEFNIRRKMEKLSGWTNLFNFKIGFCNSDNYYGIDINGIIEEFEREPFGTLLIDGLDAMYVGKKELTRKVITEKNFDRYSFSERRLRKKIGFHKTATQTNTHEAVRRLREFVHNENSSRSFASPLRAIGTATRLASPLNGSYDGIRNSIAYESSVVIDVCRGRNGVNSVSVIKSRQGNYENKEMNFTFAT
jgi:hypothetical protein